MTRLQAAIKDSNAKKWKERKLIKKVGSIFKGCMHCGSHQVFKYDEPIAAGRKYWCWDCGAIDELAWGKNWQTSGQKKLQSINQITRRKRQPKMNILAFKLVERL